MSGGQLETERENIAAAEASSLSSLLALQIAACQLRPLESLLLRRHTAAGGALQCSLQDSSQ